MQDSKIIELINISKRFPGVIALDKVNICFELGKIHCIMGENGAGKSTLAKILTGIYIPEEGNIIIEGKDALKDKKLFGKVAYVPQELDLFRNMTVAENLFFPFSKSGFRSPIISFKELSNRAIPNLQKFRITASPNDLVENISVSEQQLLQIARAMVNKYSEIIILDEPTTSLSTDDIKRLFAVLNQLKEENKAIIFISHKIDEIFLIGDEITTFRNGIKIANSQIKNITIPEVINQMTGRDINISDTFYPKKVSEEVILDVQGLAGEKFKDITFKLHKGEILGFAGLVGAGRTEIMQAIFGYLTVWTGNVKLEGKPLRLGNTRYSVKNGLIYIPEERRRQGIFPLLTVSENITMPLLKQVMSWIVISSIKEKKLSNEVIKDYEIKAPSLNQEIQFLSGGNQQKVIIGRSMFCNPRVLIFDEPTKGIDVGTKFEIYGLMKRLTEEKGIGIILISSELEELMKCSNRIITIYKGKKAGEFETDKIKNYNIINSMIGQ